MANETISYSGVKDLLRKLYFYLRFPFILLVSIFDFKRKKQESVKNIVLFRLDRLGDFVVSLPLIDSLKSEYPDAKITLVVRPYLKELAEIISSIDNVYLYGSFVKAVKELRKEKFDLAFDLLNDSKLKPAMLTFFTGAPVRVGFKWGFRELLFTLSAEGSVGGTMVKRTLELLKTLKISPKVTIPVINRKPAKKEFVAIHPGGYYPSQRWGTEKFAKLSIKIADELKAKVIIVGGPGDRKIVEEITKIADNSSVASRVTGLNELVTILSRSKVLVCNNSGPLHLASALSVPTVSTMGPTDPVIWTPVGEKNIIIRKDIECSPCSLAECGIHKCLGLITVEEMFAEVRKVLQN
ncbi:MAG: glycosyltransferase family 9 protein [Candidatus Firestonebacteria bacterium]